MSQRTAGKNQVTAAAKAGFSERTARRLDERDERRAPRGARRYRTRRDPFDTVWDSELVPLLEHTPALHALTLLEGLQERHPGQYPDKLLRTLQRRVKAWRAAHGPEKEVMFPQQQVPGLRGLSDFTVLKDVTVTIAGEPLAHRLYHFRLAYSGWCTVRVVLGGESFTALAEGLSQALLRLGGAPAEHRTDSLSAAFKNLSAEAQHDLAARYAALCAHYGMRPTRNNPGACHENGSIESPHGHLKRRIVQRLLARGSAEFPSVASYQDFLDTVTAAVNRRNATAIEAERPHLRPLPVTFAADYTELWVKVTTASTITVRLVVYSVPARLIGERLRVHLYDARLELFLGTEALLILPRVYPAPGKRRASRIDYRHLVGWLVKKPRAFYRLQYRDALLPDATYQRIWQHLDATLAPADACKRMVGALKLAAEHECQEALGTHWLAALERGLSPTLSALQQRFAPPAPATLPLGATAQHPLADYDALLPATHRSAAEEVCHG